MPTDEVVFLYRGRPVRFGRGGAQPSPAPQGQGVTPDPTPAPSQAAPTPTSPRAAGPTPAPAPVAPERAAATPKGVPQDVTPPDQDGLNLPKARGLGYADILRRIEGATTPEAKQKVIAGLAKQAGLQTGTEPSSEVPVTGSMSVRQAARLLQNLTLKKLDNLDGIKKLPPEKQDAARLALFIRNAAEEVSDFLADKRLEKSGVQWYDEDTQRLDAGLARLFREDKVLRQMGNLPSVDRETGLHRPTKSDSVANARMVLAKAVIAITSNGQKPTTNMGSALGILRQAVEDSKRKGGRESPFTLLTAWSRQLRGWRWPRGGSAEPALRQIGHLVEELGEVGAAKWLLSHQSVSELRAQKPGVKLPFGEGHDYAGSFIFGPKIGAFFLNINGQPKEVTKDLWWSRSWNRIFGSLLEHVGPVGSGEMKDGVLKPRKDNMLGVATQDEPRPHEHVPMARAARECAARLGLSVAEFQATLWYFEQQLYTALGAGENSGSYADAVENELRKIGVEPARLVHPRTEGSERRANAVSRAIRRRLDRGGPENVPPGGVHLRRPGRPVRYAQGQAPLTAAPQPQAPLATPTVTTPAQGQAPQAPQAPVVPKSPDALTAFSPNIEEGLNFDEAYGRVNAANHKTFRGIAQEVLRSSGIHDARLHDAVGDWSDGAENSVLAVLPQVPNYETAKYAASWIGLLGNQKSVLVFKTDPNGPDSTYSVEVPETSGQKLRQVLSSLGIQYRTIVPRRNGHAVVIYDEGRRLRNAVSQLAEHYSAPVREVPGRGEFVGAGSRPAARAAYRKYIREFESGRSRPASPGGGSEPDPANPEPEPVPEQGGVPGGQPGTVGPDTARKPDAGVKQLSRRGVRLRFQAFKAPPGGIVVRGVNYAGGEFIPPQEMARASPQERAAYAQRLAGGGMPGQHQPDPTTKAKRGKVPVTKAVSRLAPKVEARLGPKVGKTVLKAVRNLAANHARP